jgi:hypothetical protein
MKIEKFLTNLSEREAVEEEVEEEAAPEVSGERMKIITDTSAVFRGKITKPVMVTFKYKELADKLRESLGMPITRDRAKTVFDIVKSMMGL